MVTVKQFLDAGFEFAIGDEVSNAIERKFLISKNIVEQWNEPCEPADIESFVHSVAWRKNTGVQPVSDDYWVEVLRRDTGETDIGMAGEYLWDGGVLVKWKPSLKHLEEQTNNNQETKTALEMSERELKDSDEVVWGRGDIAIHEGREVLVIGWHPHHPVLVVEGSDGFFTASFDKLSKSLTPGRDEAVNAMLKDAGYICTVEEYRLNKLSSIMDAAIESMFELYDAGYRKQ